MRTNYKRPFRRRHHAFISYEPKKYDHYKNTRKRLRITSGRLILYPKENRRYMYHHKRGFLLIKSKENKIHGNEMVFPKSQLKRWRSPQFWQTLLLLVKCPVSSRFRIKPRKPKSYWVAEKKE